MGTHLKPDIEFLYFPGCPHAKGALRLTREVVDRILPGHEVALVPLETDEETRSRDFLGSPSGHVDGIAIEGGAAGSRWLCCRLYNGGTGVPPEWMIEAGILRALRPRHILFLCVANSARSQMAEGIALSLAPEGVRVSSADIFPAASCDIVFLALHPPAIPAALGEIGSRIRPDATLVSLAPKISLAKLSEMAGGARNVARVIPNAPSIVGDGYNPVAFSGNTAPEVKSCLLTLLRVLGECPEVPEDSLEATCRMAAGGAKALRSSGLSPEDASTWFRSSRWRTTRRRSGRSTVRNCPPRTAS